MQIADNNLAFQWDKPNRDKIWHKHRVSWWECEEVFFNVPMFVFPDMKHSGQEERYYALGRTNAARLLFVVFTIRQSFVRGISARDMNRKERKIYHEKTQENTKV
jgi:uncharacterized DUF497 family protein